MGSPPEVEQLLALDAGDTYFHVLVDKLQRVGLAAPTLVWHPANRDEQVFSATRIEGAAMAREDRAEAFIADYKQAYADLEKELQTPTLAEYPRVLAMGAQTRDWNSLSVIGVKETHFDDRRIGIENAAEGFEDIGRQQDAERILAMNPDIVVTLGKLRRNSNSIRAGEACARRVKTGSTRACAVCAAARSRFMGSTSDRCGRDGPPNSRILIACRRRSCVNWCATTF